MTKKDYELLATALRASKHVYAGDETVYLSKMNQWNASVTFVSEALAKDNPRFNRERFLLACGVEE